jgi:DNA (cytosine-5)-methyltransferase 1
MEMAGENLATVAYVEIESFAISNLVTAMETGTIHPAPIWTNLKTFDAQPFCGSVDIIIGGYPCQPFSVAGQRKGSEDPRHLWPYYEKIIASAKPFRCFFENVEGHVTNGFSEVYQSLRNMGYRVEAGLYTSKETGGSHIRKRLFILAELENANNARTGLRRQSIKKNKTQYSSKSELANSESKKSEGLRERKEEEESSARESSKELANHNGKGLQGDEREVYDSQGWQESFGSITERCLIAPPGELQCEWESPRENTKEALKSRLGLPANGYDYRTDLLRALGNGVDPWTAKTAWIDLNNKMRK